MKATGYDLTKILRAVNVKQQRGSSKQQGQEQVSESKPKTAEDDENLQNEQTEAEDDDEAATPSNTASLPKAAACLQSGGCYVCGRSSSESRSIFVPMSNEGRDSCVTSACSNVT
jgi:hypothetical protein